MYTKVETGVMESVSILCRSSILLFFLLFFLNITLSLLVIVSALITRKLNNTTLTQVPVAAALPADWIVAHQE